MEGGHGEPLYAQINRELKTKRIHSAANTLTKSEAMNASKQIYDHYDLDGGCQSQGIYQSNHDIEQLADNRTDSAKLQNSVVAAAAAAATADPNNFYKKFHNNNNNNTNINNTNTDQNQWV